MTIKEFLATLRDDGYEGESDRASVKSWFESSDCLTEFRGKSGTLKFCDLWPEKITRKGITLTIAQNEDAPDTVNVVDGAKAEGDEPDDDETPTGDEPMDDTDEPKRRNAPSARKARGIAGKASNRGSFFIGNANFKAYQSKIARRDAGGFSHIKERAVFDNASKAEIAGASLRLSATRKGGIFDYPQKSNDETIVAKAAAEGIMSQGGALVPDIFVPEMITLINEYGAARQLCNFRDHPTGVAEFPRRTADPTVSWSEEGSSLTDQNPAYDNVKVVANKLAGIMYVSNEILNDAAISVADDLMNGFANGVALKEDNAFFLGDGTSTYGGVVGFNNAIGSAGIKTQGTGNTWGAVTNDDLQAMFGTLQSIAWTDSPKMTCTPGAFYQIVNRISTNKGGVTMVESQAGVVRPIYNGFPVVFNNVMASATATATISILFGAFDFAAKCIQVSNSLEFATSEHYRFGNDQLTLRARERVGIVVHDAGDASNSGPVVALKTGA